MTIMNVMMRMMKQRLIQLLEIKVMIPIFGVLILDVKDLKMVLKLKRKHCKIGVFQPEICLKEYVQSVIKIIPTKIKKI